jgi:hypothetical protein
LRRHRLARRHQRRSCPTGLLTNLIMGLGCLSGVSHLIGATNAACRWTKPADEASPCHANASRFASWRNTPRNATHRRIRTRPRNCHGRWPQGSYEIPVSVEVLCAPRPSPRRWWTCWRHLRPIAMVPARAVAPSVRLRHAVLWPRSRPKPGWAALQRGAVSVPRRSDRDRQRRSVSPCRRATCA